jgi:hypothetical protein
MIFLYIRQIQQPFFALECLHTEAFNELNG